MFEEYRRRLQHNGSNVGEAIKNRSDKIKDAVFKYDVGYRKCYILKDGQIFPRQNETEYKKAKEVFFGRDVYDPSKLDQFEMIECKYSTHLYKSISSSDDPDYYLEFRPNAHKTNRNIKVGALIFVPDDIGIYNLWLIVATDKRPQFPQYYILQVNWLLKFGSYNQNVLGGDRPKTYFQWCVNRARNSYNSGVWSDYLTTSVENQDAIWLSTNIVSKKIWYNTRLVMDDEFSADANVVTWKISKVERTHPRGISKYTMTQEIYDVEDWSVRLIDCDITDNPDHSLKKDYYYPGRMDGVGLDAVGASVIEYSGDGAIRVGYSKKFTAHFFDENRQYDVSKTAVPSWTLLLSDGLEYNLSDSGEAEYITYEITDKTSVVVKCKRDYSLIGSRFTLKMTDLTESRESSVEVEVTG